MNGTLLLACCGPMQSWGTQSRFTVRDTGREPSKSGVIGLLCAALGRPRHEPVDDLAALRMGVRVDREGRLEKDFHTVSQERLYKVKGKAEPSDPVISNRYYLADACFLVGLEGDSDLLSELHHALADPVWPLYLGRKAFVPGRPPWLHDGLHERERLVPALAGYNWLVQEGEPPPAHLRLVLEDPQGSVVVHDTPISFVQRDRRFRPRRVRISTVRDESWTTPLEEG